MEANIGQRFVADGLIEQGPVGAGALGRGVAQGQPAGMRTECGVAALPQIGGAAGPAPRGGIVDKPRTRGVEFDVAIAAQHVVLAVDQAGLVAAFPCFGFRSIALSSALAGPVARAPGLPTR